MQPTPVPIFSTVPCALPFINEADSMTIDGTPCLREDAG